MVGGGTAAVGLWREVVWNLGIEVLRGGLGGALSRAHAPGCPSACPECRLVSPEEVISRSLLLLCVLLSFAAGLVGGLLVGLCCGGALGLCGRRERRFADDRRVILNARSRGGH